MNAIFWWVLENTIVIVLLIPLVAAVCRLFRNRPAVQHVLWVVLLFKFIMPPVWSWPWSVAQLWPTLRPAALARLDSAPDGTKVLLINAISRETAEKLTGGASRALAGSAATRTTDPARTPARGEQLARVSLWAISAVWLLGMAGCAIKQSRRIARHAALLRRAAAPPQQLTEAIAAIARGVGLRPPRALVTAGITSPFMWFLGRLRLVWPEVMSSREAVVRARGVIAHELAHVRRGDHLVAWVELVAGLVWWWNPLFWFVRRRCRESAELACDALALEACPEGRRSYAELLLELSAGLRTSAPAPALGMSAGSTSSFERRLSMILSDRVSGKVSVAGFLAAGFLAIAALPGWSFGQKPDAAPAKTAVQAEPGEGATAARLQQIEAELKRLSSLLEHTKPSEGLKPPPPGEGVKGESVIHWRTYSPTSTADPSAILFKTNARNYVVSVKDRTAFLSALDKEGRLVWHGRLLGTIPGDVAGGAWGLEESDEPKQVFISCTGNGKRTTFRFDAVTGKLLTGDFQPSAPAVDERERSENAVRSEVVVRGLSPGEEQDKNRLALFHARLSGLGYFKNESPQNQDVVKKLQPAIVFGRGQNRIYILNTRINEEKQCFLSAQNDHARQIWRTTFFNPLLTERFAKTWHDSLNVPLPANGLAGDWRIEESNDQKQVVVTWEGSGVRVRLRFEIASGELQEEVFLANKLVQQSGRPPATEREIGAGTQP